MEAKQRASYIRGNVHGFRLKIGFEIVKENEEEYIMVYYL